ncbi:hypothetical protein [Teredinibacter turnerae]|uniref:hypothetical protein n=1 Tax=Teredinibacter turnerae TaxID=2426 RepID=UPI0030CF77C8
MPSPLTSIAAATKENIASWFILLGDAATSERSHGMQSYKLDLSTTKLPPKSGTRPRTNCEHKKSGAR